MLKDHQIKLYYLLSFLGLLQFSLPVWIFIARDYLGFNYLQIYLLTALPYLSNLIFELPTGSWADRFGRKKIFVIGMFIAILGDIPLLLTKNFYVIAAGLTIVGFGGALKSGTLGALHFEYIYTKYPEDAKKRYRKLVSNKQSFAFLGRAVAALFAGSLYLIHPLAPIAAYLFCQLFVIFFCIFLIEPKTQRKSAGNDLKQILNTVKILRKTPDMIRFVLLLLGFVILANMLFFSYQPYFESLGFQVATIASFYIGIPVISALGSQIFKRIEHINDFRVLNVMFLVTAISGLIFFLINTAPGVLVIVLLSLVFGFQSPLTEHFINHKVKDEVRSTSLSTVSLGLSLAISISSTIVGITLQHGDTKVLGLVVTLVTLVIFLLNQFLPHPRS